MEHDETMRRNKWTEEFRRRMSSRFGGTSNEFPPPGVGGVEWGWGGDGGWMKSNFHAAMVIASRQCLALAGRCGIPRWTCQDFSIVSPGPHALYD